MSEIQRYGLKFVYRSHWEIVEDAAGEYVTYDDHVAAVAEARDVERAKCIAEFNREGCTWGELDCADYDSANGPSCLGCKAYDLEYKTYAETEQRTRAAAIEDCAQIAEAHICHGFTGTTCEQPTCQEANEVLIEIAAAIRALAAGEPSARATVQYALTIGPETAVSS